MPTAIGIVFFCCGAYCFLFRERALFGLVIIAGVFEAASAINIGDRGIQPYYVVAAFIICRGLLKWLAGGRAEKDVPGNSWLLIFGVIGVASAFVLPFIFAGTPVYDPKVGIDDGLFIRPPLVFGLNNLAQAGFLSFHIATAFCVVSLGFSSDAARKAFRWAFYIVFLIIAAQSICQVVGVEFPNSLILNNPGYSLWTSEQEVGGTRNPGPFAEPSLAGGFLAMYCIGFLAEYLEGKGGAIRVILAFVASGLVASAGSLVTLAFAMIVLLFSYTPFRFPWHINVARARRLACLILLLGLPVILSVLAFSNFRDALLVNTVSKTDSGSFLNRTASDLYALELVRRSWGIGVGLGSNRASSLFTTLLSNVGVLGVFVFGGFCATLLAKLPEGFKWLKWGIGALLLNMCINIPDVTMPMLWIPLLLAIQFSARKVPAHRSIAEAPALAAT